MPRTLRMQGPHSRRGRAKAALAERESGTFGLATLSRPNALVAAGAVIAAILSVGWFVTPFANPADPAGLLREQGDWGVVSSPATFHLPGTINTVEVRSDGRIELHPTCKIDPELLAKMTLSSRTVDRSLAEKLNRNLDISGQLQDLLSAGAEGRRTRSVNVSYQNSNILQVTYEDLIHVQREIIKGACEEAIIWNINSGATVCQTRAALRADMIYDIVYDESISVNEQGKLTADAAAKLKLQAASDKSDRMLGTGLIYGVKLVPKPILLRDAKAAPAMDCRVRMY